MLDLSSRRQRAAQRPAVCEDFIALEDGKGWPVTAVFESREERLLRKTVRRRAPSVQPDKPLQPALAQTSIGVNTSQVAFVLSSDLSITDPTLLIWSFLFISYQE
eukprot:SAG31_NODE_919_length_11010_cov_27.449821_11_plen_105_part_00